MPPELTNPNPSSDPPSLVNGGAPPPPEPEKYTPDPNKSVDENAAAQKAFDEAAAKTAAEAKAKDEAEAKTKAEAEAAAKANDTKATPFKLEEIKVPEGMSIDEAVSKPFVDIVNKFGLGRDAVSELVALQAKAMNDASEKGSADWNKLQDTWRDEVMKDADIGGAKWQGAQSSIAKVLDEFGTPELRSALDLTGAGNNPHVVKFLAKIGSKFTEGGFTGGSPGAGPKDAANLLYPDQGKS